MGRYSSAACEILQWLLDQKIEGGPVAQPTKNDPVIVVYGMSQAGISKLPKTWGEFRVEGTTAKPNYDRGQLRDILPCQS